MGVEMTTISDSPKEAEAKGLLDFRRPRGYGSANSYPAADHFILQRWGFANERSMEFISLINAPWAKPLPMDGYLSYTSRCFLTFG